MAFAQTSTSTASTTSALVNQIAGLLQQVKALQEQLANLQKQRGEITTQMQSALNLSRQLSVGMTGDEVKLLQEMLATDPDIYPEKLVTGYFGSLTEKAVKRFQAKFGIEQAGRVGPQTLARINQILTEGAGNSGKVPPGLLIAPGIAKKLGSTTPLLPLPGQILPPGIAKKLGLNYASTTIPDTTAPVLSNLTASAASTTAVISWQTNEIANGSVWFGSTTPVSLDANPNMHNSLLTVIHSFNLTNLTPTTTYYYAVRSVDQAGNAATSSQGLFVTGE